MSIKDLTKEAELKSQIEIAQKGINSAEEAGIIISQNKISALNDLIAATLEAKALSEEQIANLKEEVEQRQQAYDQVVKLSGATSTAALDAKKNLDEIVKKQDDLNSLRKQDVKEAQDQLETEKEINKELKKREDNKDALYSKTQQILSAMTGIDDMAKSTVIGQFFVTAQAIGFAGALGQVTSAASKLFTVSNLLGSAGIGLGLMLLKNVWAAESARAEFNALTGASGKFDEQILASAPHMKKLGLDTRDYANSLASMRRNFGWFKELEDGGDSLAKLNAQMGKLGANQDALNRVQDLIHNFGEGGPSIEDFTLKLQGVADVLGMDVRDVVDQAGDSMERFAVYGGEEMSKQFTKMIGQAKALGVKVKDLTNITKEYDTVSGSLQAAAKLNIALGGQYISANEMMGLSDSQRIQMIQDKIKASGKDINAMSVAQKRRFIALSGIKDETLALKLLSGKQADAMKENAEAADTAASSEEKLAEAMQAAMGPMDKMAAAFADILALVKPIVEGIHFIVDGFAALFGAGPVATILGIATAWGTWKLAIWAVKGGLTTLGGKLKGMLPFMNKGNDIAKKSAENIGKQAAATGTLAGGQAAATPTTSAFGMVAAMSAKQIMAMGVALLAAAAGIAIIVLSLAVLASQMKEMTAGQMAMFAVTIAAIGAVLYFVIPAFASSATGATAAAAAFTGFGIAVAIAAPATVALGLGMLVFAAGFAVVMLLMPFFAIFVGLLGALTVIAPIMIAAGLMIAGGFMAMAAGLIALGIGLWFVDSDDLESLAQMMTGLGQVAANMGGGISDAVPVVEELMDTLDDLGTGTLYGASLGMQSITDTFASLGLAASMASWGVEELAEAFELIPESKVVAFTTMFEKVAEETPTILTLTPQAVDNVSNLVDEAHSMVGALLLAETFGVGDLLVEWAKANNQATGGGGGTGAAPAAAAATPPVVIEVDGREIGKIAERYINKNNSLTALTRAKP
jgi:hypothetical protein